MSRPLITAAQATGSIKLYQFVVGGILLLNVPISYFMLREGNAASSVFIIAIVLTFSASIARVVMLKRIYDFSFLNFAKISLMRISLVSILTSALALILNQFFDDKSSLVLLGVYFGACLTMTTLTIFIVGIEHHERNRLVSMLRFKS